MFQFCAHKLLVWRNSEVPGSALVLGLRRLTALKMQKLVELCVLHKMTDQTSLTATERLMAKSDVWRPVNERHLARQYADKL